MISRPQQTSATPDSAPTAGYVLALVSSVSTAAATVVGKWNLEAISPLLLNSLIFSVATVVLTVTVPPLKGIRSSINHTRQGWLWLGLFSISSWLALWAFWAGVQRMDPSLAAFLNRTEVLVAILMAIIFLKERFTRLETLGAVLSVAGIVIMRLTLRVEYSAGFWLVLLGALFFGITEFVSKIAVRHVDPIVLTYVRNAFLAGTFWLVFFAGGRSFDGLEQVWPGVIALGLLGPIIARLIYLQALKKLELSRVAVISQSQPVFVVLISLAALGQLPTFREVTGGLFLSAGCLLMILARRRTASIGTFIPGFRGKKSETKTQ